MDKGHIIDHFRNQLARDVVGQGDSLPRFKPMNISPWLAMSLMQKAIRRGREEMALRAAATLLNQAPERLWRRICVTAYEDIGVGDFDTIALVAAALKGKRWRTDVGGDWAVASTLVARMCGSIKCRAADDLAYVCERHPRFEAARLAWSFEPLPRLLQQIISDAPIPERAIALWYALGTNRYNTTALRERRGEPQAAFDGLSEHGFPDTVIEVCRVGFRKCSEIITAFIILLHREVENASCHVEPDDLPAEILIGEVPCWAYDMHVREGKQAIARLLKTDCETARWARDHIPAKSQMGFFGHVLFHIESGLVDRRLHWPSAGKLRQMADVSYPGLTGQQGEEAMSLLRRDLPVLHEERRHVANSNSR